MVNSLLIKNNTYGSSVEFTMKNVREGLKKARGQDASSSNMSSQDTNYLWEDHASIASTARRRAEIATNLQLPNADYLKMRDLDPTDLGVVGYRDLIDKLTSQRQNPRLIVRTLRWNVQQNAAKAKS